MSVQIYLRDGDALTLALVADATVREGLAIAQKVTRHPVERGSRIADHYEPEPDSLTVEIVVSNTPILPSSQVIAAKPGEGARVAQALAALQKLKGSLVDVVTSQKRYQSYVMESISTSRTSSTGDVLAFTVNFTEFRSVTSLTVKLSKSGISGDGRANRGHQPPKTADDAARNQSWLYKLDQDLFGGVLKRAGSAN